MTTQFEKEEVIMTIRHLKQAIRQCKRVAICPRLGSADIQVYISKIEAMYLVSTIRDVETPIDLELSSERFGILVGGVLNIGP